ncbi:hypothetical protein GOP47_0020176 [Adiantum capillus-veneris]|uniref:J domain-containing protein n=1 Tax=Adiantum capillus-veneris TaxID=13818 RepID=A0A9D4UCI5_ADICA|nr:hypothetical protein GOP47_0020176 [Adiantum capillus-veneris]
MGSQSAGHFNYPPGVDSLPDFHKDYYKVLEVDYYAKEDIIRTNYLRLALKWHPDKHNGEEFAKARFQEINEAYRVLIDPAKRLDYDLGVEIPLSDYSAAEYLERFRGLILTCNGLGMGSIPRW